MLYYLHELESLYSPLRIFEFVTFRALAGSGTAFILSLVFGPPMIRWLTRLKIGEQIRGDDDGEALRSLHKNKQDTPTMGGVLIILSVTLSSFLWGEPTNPFLIIAVATMCYMGAIGFADDYLKIKHKSSKAGLSARQKLFLQGLWVVLLVVVLLRVEATSEHVRHLMVPFLKEPFIHDLGLFGIWLFLFLVLVGASNAVNLTDGLDGLAVGCTSPVAFAYLVMAYVAGNFVFADYLLVPFVKGSHELAVFCGCLLGACLGFLWYNCHPARVFMGDTGSLALGGAIAAVAILIKQELVLVIVGGVFVIEALSVLLQVTVFKMSGGKRVFRCAPIHHHFELLEKERAEKNGRSVGVVETMITIRFWIISIIFALLGVATLKIR